MASPVLTAAASLAAGAAGGALFRAIGMPLPWTLGAIAAAATLTLAAGPDWALPPVFRNGARPVIGVMAGSAFTPAVVQGMADWWPAVPVLIGYMLLSVLVGRVFFQRLCGYDATTATFASTPGGLGEMTLLGGQLGGDVRRLVVIHLVRILAVVTAVPFLVSVMAHPEAIAQTGALDRPPPATLLDWGVLAACAGLGYLFGGPVRILGGVMTAALLFSAAAHATELTLSAPPGWLVAAMQVVIGCISGARFGGSRWIEVRATALHALAWTALLLAMAMPLAWLLSTLLGMSLAGPFLALSPGGFAEMSIIAFATGIEVAFVVTCHVIRSLSVTVMAPLLHRAMSGGPG